MVLTKADLDALPPAERIKKLMEIQDSKKKELKNVLTKNCMFFCYAWH